MCVGIGFYRHQQRKEVESKIENIKQHSPGILIDNRKHAVDYMWNILKPVHETLRCEALVIVYLDGMNKIIDTDVRIGSSASVTYPTEEIANSAINKEAIKVVLGHNHPGNYTAPSDNDVYHCASLYTFLSSNRIQLIDDLVVCGVQLRSIMNTHRFKQMIRNY